jgi:hypothetical protein
MDPYRKLAEQLKGIAPKTTSPILQGVVKAVDGNICTVTIDDIDLTDVRLRATTTDNTNQMLIVPKIGSVVILGSLSGDLNELVVLSCDEVESITLNGGALGGLIKINELKTQLDKMTARIDGIISAINNGVATPGTDGGAALLTTIKAGLATITNKEAFTAIEDEKIKH